MTNAQVISSGAYIPNRKVSNEQLESLLGLEKGYIEKTTGIKSRRWAEDYETVEFMAGYAAADAVRKTGIKRVDAIFVCRDAILTRRAYSLTPAIKNALADFGIDTKGAFSVDTVNYCAGYAQACNMASLMVNAGQIENALVVASTKYDDVIVRDSKFYEAIRTPFNPNQNAAIEQFSVSNSNPGFQSPALNAFLWGCGAGAVLIGSGENSSIIGSKTRSNHRFEEDNFGFGRTRSQEDTFGQYKGEDFCVLDGASIYKYAVSEIPPFVKETCQELGLDLKTLKVVSHQPQPRMLERLAEKIGMPQENLMVSCDVLGNCTAASLPITYHLARQEDEIKPGDDVAFLSFGDSYLTASMFAFKEGAI